MVAPTLTFLSIKDQTHWLFLSQFQTIGVGENLKGLVWGKVPTLI